VWCGCGSPHGIGDVDSCRRDQKDGQTESDDCRGAFGASAGKSAIELELFTADGTGVAARERG
jgi:hypothetical protein